MVSPLMLISILSMSAEPLEMSYAEVVVVAPWARYLKHEDWSQLHLMCVFKKLNLS